MRVGIVMPAFNAAATISEAVASLRAQQHRDWTLIVVDDGSTDDTAAILARIVAVDDRVHLLRQPNAGEASARNAGLAALDTEWVAFLDADDWVAPTWLARLAAEAEADPSRDVIHCRWARVAGDGTIVPVTYQAPSGDLFDVWAHRSAFPVHAALVRRSLVSELGGFDASLEKSTDWDLWQRIARTGTRFQAIPDLLAYYRMSPMAVSLDAAAMLRDGLTVLRRGHAPDPRVRHPAPAHARGRPGAGVGQQAFYLLAWCAGLMLGRGEDARGLLTQVADLTHPGLDPDGIADCLLDAMPLPSCVPPTAWESLWPGHRDAIDLFLVALESAARAPALAHHTRLALARKAALHAPSWQEVTASDLARRDQLEAQVRELQEAIERLQRREQQHRLAEVEQREAVAALRAAAAEQAALLDRRTQEIATAQATLQAARHDAARLEFELGREIAHAREALAHERDRTAGVEQALRAEVERAAGLADALQWSEQGRQHLLGAAEHRLGDLLLNRLHLRRPLAAVHAGIHSASQWKTLARLRWDRWRSRDEASRVMATVCSTFPIYSQTFVHQELASMIEDGYQVRLGYSTAAPFADLGGRFESLWPARRRLEQHVAIHRRSLARFRQRMPGRVDALIDALAEASGLDPAQVAAHGNVLEGFTYARMAEAYGARYLHSYFFYDRTLMSLIAAELLDIPRGVSCYADHMLRDYELKVVPLHLRRAALVVATSARIRDELLAIAPDMDPAKILVKPNGIDCRRFPVIERAEPAAGLPHRLVVVCRIEPKKGLIELVEALALLRQRGIAVEVHVVGVADEWSPASVRYRDALDQRIGDLGLWGAVHLEGRQDHAGILRFLHQAHAFVAPFVETEGGDKDGIPTALLEGMATGLPVIATRAGSIPEVVRDGVEGTLVPPRDPAALADAIAALLAASATRHAMGVRAAARVRETFDVAVCEAALHRRIRELTARGRAA
jgi:glycosyltransferase involved in cell wall biosynthesis